MSHDDHNFHVADRIIKLEYGQLEYGQLEYDNPQKIQPNP
jgi:ABC-type siderophore export system fused ATPase/permease subunit